jgi:hypothetical protein
MRIREFGPSQSPIEVVVPTADIEGSLFKRCFQSIRESSESDVHMVAVEERGPSFSFPVSINSGISRTSQDILLLNDDAWLSHGALSEIRRARSRFGEGVFQLYVHDEQARPHDVGWRIDTSMLGPIRYAIRYFAPFTVLRSVARGTMLPIFYERHPRPGFDGFSFTAALVSRRALEAVGPLDESMPLGYEDVDYSFRCHALSVPYYCATRAVAYHQRNATRRSGDPREMKSLQRLVEKWPRTRIVSTLAMGPKGLLA